MAKVDVFFEVFTDVGVPPLSVDMWKLHDALKQIDQSTIESHFGVKIEASPEKKDAFISSFRAMFKRITISNELKFMFAMCLPVKGSACAKRLMQFDVRQAKYAITEVNDKLIWNETSFWPMAYSTFLTQLVNIITLHKTLIEVRIEEMSTLLKARGFSPENTRILSEFPRQLPTHFHYAVASLGAWCGGAINVQYFGYYATIRQIHHSGLNVKYAQRIGFDSDISEKLDSSGLVILPASLVYPLLEAQGTYDVFGSYQIDAQYSANLPADSLDPAVDSNLPGLFVDKYYSTPFFARNQGSHGFYGTENVFRDHYEQFYSGLNPISIVRCKHYCVPVVEISSIDELASYISKIPIHHKEGIFFRGQNQLYTIKRDELVQKMLFGESCCEEPSLVTSASRYKDYDYDPVHFLLKHFLEQKIIQNDNQKRNHHKTWQTNSVSPDCRLDYAILALAQHYGLLTHGLDITTNYEVAMWFATNICRKDDDTGLSTYRTMVKEDWADDPGKWPVVLACQTVTNSIQQSLHDCQELTAFGFEAKRPHAQNARFFLGGHSDHQNRLAEAVVCIFRLKPGNYKLGSTFDSLFPSPENDPAYRVLLEFADFSPIGKKYIHRFHN